jgi:hypothetical protein
MFEIFCPLVLICYADDYEWEYKYEQVQAETSPPAFGWLAPSNPVPQQLLPTEYPYPGDDHTTAAEATVESITQDFSVAAIEEPMAQSSLEHIKTRNPKTTAARFDQRK